MPLFGYDHYPLPDGWVCTNHKKKTRKANGYDLGPRLEDRRQTYAHPTKGVVGFDAEARGAWLVRYWPDHLRLDKEQDLRATVMLCAPQVFYAWEALHGISEMVDGDDTRLQSLTYDLTCMGEIHLLSTIAVSDHTTTEMLITLLDTEVANAVAEREDLDQRPEVVEAILYNGDYHIRQILAHNKACPKWARTLALTMLTST